MQLHIASTNRHLTAHRSPSATRSRLVSGLRRMSFQTTAPPSQAYCPVAVGAMLISITVTGVAPVSHRLPNYPTQRAGT